MNKMKEEFQRKRGEILEIAVDTEDIVDGIIERYIQPREGFYLFHHLFLNDLTLGPKIGILGKILKYENINDIDIIFNAAKINEIYNIIKHSEVIIREEELYLDPRKTTMHKSSSIIEPAEIKTKKIKIEDCLTDIIQYKNNFNKDKDNLLSRIDKISSR